MVFRSRTKATVRVIYFFIRRQFFFTTTLYGYYAYVQCTRIIHKLSKHKFNSTGVYLRYNIYIYIILRCNNVGTRIRIRRTKFNRFACTYSGLYRI